MRSCCTSPLPPLASRNAQAPFLGPGQRFRLVEGQQFTVPQQGAAGDVDVGDLVAAGGIDQLRQHVVHRLGGRPVQIHGDEVGRLALHQGADHGFQPQGLGAGEGRHAQRRRRRQNAGVAGHALGQQRSGAQLAEQVEVVVAGGAVGADGDVDAGGEQLRHRAEAAGQLEVGFRAVRHAHAELAGPGDLLVCELGHVHGDEVLAQQVQLAQALPRPLAAALDGAFDFASGLVQVHVDADAQLGGQFTHPAQRRVGHGVGRMGREHRRHQRVAAQAVVHLQAAMDVLLPVLCPGGGEVEHDQPDAGAQADFAGHRGGGVGEEIHIVEAGGAAADHLGGGQAHAIGAEGVADVGALGRPDMVLQPVHQRQVVGQPAQQAHRRMRVRVDQARRHGVMRQFQYLARLECLPRELRRQHLDDAPAVHGQGVLFEHHAGGFNRYQPARQHQQIDGLHSQTLRTKKIECAH